MSDFEAYFFCEVHWDVLLHERNYVNTYCTSVRRECWDYTGHSIFLLISDLHIIAFFVTHTRH